MPLATFTDDYSGRHFTIDIGNGSYKVVKKNLETFLTSAYNRKIAVTCILHSCEVCGEDTNFVTNPSFWYRVQYEYKYQ